METSTASIMFIGLIIYIVVFDRKERKLLQEDLSATILETTRASKKSIKNLNNELELSSAETLLERAKELEEATGVSVKESIEKAQEVENLLRG